MKHSNRSRFARCHEVLPYTIQTAVNFLTPLKPVPRGGMDDGKFRVYWASTHRSPGGVRYNRLLRLRRRLHTQRPQS